MKRGLVLEGGAMRGMYTAGVTDVMMEHHIEFDGAIGVSAGAVFGCNYKSRQPGRVIRYNKRFCREKRFASLYSLLTTGDLYGVDFCYRMIPDSLDPFDTAEYERSPMKFYVVCTDIATGEPVYKLCDRGDAEDVQYMRASASMPIAARPVRMGDYLLLDGGISDSIPIRFMERIGYDQNVVVLTQPRGYIKKKNKAVPLLRTIYRKYPALARSVARRHIVYNETIRYIEQKEAEGSLFVIRPPAPLNIGSVEHDPTELERVYQIGRKAAKYRMTELERYLAK